MYGQVGVLAYDRVADKVECHICGEWFRGLNTHVLRTHNVTTDENGVASFYLIYPKASAAWITARIEASTIVLGTETQSTYTFGLGWKAGEECSLPHSPYNCP